MTRTNPKRLGVALVALALLAASCTDGDSADEATTSTGIETTAVLDTTTTEVQVETGFEEMDCIDLGIDAEIEVTCGNLEVPANWETGE